MRFPLDGVGKCAEKGGRDRFWVNRCVSPRGGGCVSPILCHQSIQGGSSDLISVKAKEKRGGAIVSIGALSFGEGEQTLIIAIQKERGF